MFQPTVYEGDKLHASNRHHLVALWWIWPAQFPTRCRKEVRWSYSEQRELRMSRGDAPRGGTRSCSGKKRFMKSRHKGFHHIGGYWMRARRCYWRMHR